MIPIVCCKRTPTVPIAIEQKKALKATQAIQVDVPSSAVQQQMKVEQQLTK